MITVFRKGHRAKIYSNHTFDIINKGLFIYDDEDRVICVYADGNWAKMTVDYGDEAKPSGTTSPVMVTFQHG